MKVYWSDREGKTAPLFAQFQCLPFFADGKVPFSHPVTRIETLPPPEQAIVLHRQFLPDRKHWTQMIEAALSKKIEKIVLARSQILKLATKPDPFALTAALKKRAQGAYVFCFSEGDTAFLGASPERLFSRNSNQLLSEAIAGTRKRGQTTEEDERLGKELLESVKDLSEFDPVVKFLKNSLLPLCNGPLFFSPISLHKTHNVQHLYSQCKGTLRENAFDREILSQIHPTPALSGTPPLKALDLIRELEPFDRGLYGGVVGWSAPEASDWVVGIRSCFIRGHFAYLYAGTGIVEGSKAEEEWEELDQKTKLYDSIFL